MRYQFRWNAWNVDHIAEHGITPDEAEYVVNRAEPPFPREQGDRYLVQGQTEQGWYIQVAYVIDPPPLVFVIHARPLTEREKRRYRRQRR